MTDGADSDAATADATADAATANAVTDTATADTDTTGELRTERLVTADRLRLRTRRGWVYREVDLGTPAGSVTTLAVCWHVSA